LGEIGLRGEATLGSVADAYGIDIRTAGAGSLGELLLSRLPEPRVGGERQLVPARLRVTGMRDGRVLSINLPVTSGPAGPAANEHAAGCRQPRGAGVLARCPEDGLRGCAGLAPGTAAGTRESFLARGRRGQNLPSLGVSAGCAGWHAAAAALVA